MKCALMEKDEGNVLLLVLIDSIHSMVEYVLMFGERKTLYEAALTKMKLSNQVVASKKDIVHPPSCSCTTNTTNIMTEN